MWLPNVVARPLLLATVDAWGASAWQSRWLMTEFADGWSQGPAVVGTLVPRLCFAALSLGLAESHVCRRG